MCFKDRSLKLQSEKCWLFERAVCYLGHVVSQEGVTTDPKKTEVVQLWPQPITVKDVHSFLRFVGYYRQFIPGFPPGGRAAAWSGCDLPSEGGRDRRLLNKLPVVE